MKPTLSPVSISHILTDFAQLTRHGVPYGYGAKAEGGRDPRNGHKWNIRSNHTISTPISTIDHIDCSGFVRYILWLASGMKMLLPDGSQAQLGQFEDWAHEGLVHETNLQDAVRYITKSRMFIGFIKPFTNGCGSVGHVFLIANIDADSDAETMESYGGVGVSSRSPLTAVLKRETYKVFEIPTMA